MKYGFGVDIGGTTVKIAFFTQGGDLLEKWEIPTALENDGANILPDVANALLTYLNQKQLNKSQILGIGVGIPGAVKDGVVNRCINLNWGIVDVQAVLSGLTGLNVSTGNDANLAALGEAWKGSASGCKNMVLATLGTGLGGGVVMDGKLVNGANASGGEIGHIVLNPEETELCTCGNRGCAEQYCSATGVVRLAKRYLDNCKEESVLRNLPNMTCKDVFDSAKAGDACATAILEQMYALLGRLLATVCNTVDPEIMVIGGGVSNAGQPLLDGIARHFPRFAFHALRDKAQFRIASLGNDAGVYGAMKLLADECSGGQ